MNKLNFTKACFKCGLTKQKSEFYKHSEMSDGFLGKCKTCSKLDAKARTDILTSTPEGLEKERERNREKYHRLNYYNKSIELNKNKPWTKSYVYKNLSRKFKTPPNTELHHWNYNEKYLEDVFLMDVKEHRKAHVFLELDNDSFMFKTLEGILLDSKEKHLSYLISKNIKFNI